METLATPSTAATVPSLSERLVEIRRALFLLEIGARLKYLRDGRTSGR